MAYGDTKVLMVCLGNICRSPMAEGILRQKAAELGKNVFVDSAGTADYHTGEAPDHRAVKCMKSYGIDIAGLRARQFTRHDFQSFDIIFTMDEKNYNDVLSLARNDDEKARVRMFLNEAWPQSNRPVPDPWFGDMDGFHEVFDLLNSAADAYLKHENFR